MELDLMLQSKMDSKMTAAGENRIEKTPIIVLGTEVYVSLKLLKML